MKTRHPDRCAGFHLDAAGPHIGTNIYSDLAHHADNEELPGVIAFRPEASLIYFNADSVLEKVSTVASRPA